MKRTTLRLAHALLAIFALGTVPTAASAPFQEDFATDHANWLNFNSSAFLTYQPTGGPDGSSFVSGNFNFMNSVVGDQGPVVFRAGSTPLGPASGGNFFGNWIADGVAQFTAWVRHDATVPLTYFTRFADPVNFPGATAIQFAPVLPNTWTPLDFAIDASSPNFVTFEGMSFETVFDNIGRLQIGVSIPAALAGVDQQINFDLDQVSIQVPEPASIALGCLAIAAIVPLRSRRPQR